MFGDKANQYCTSSSGFSPLCNMNAVVSASVTVVAAVVDGLRGEAADGGPVGTISLERVV